MVFWKQKIKIPDFLKNYDEKALTKKGNHGIIIYGCNNLVTNNKKLQQLKKRPK